MLEPSAAEPLRVSAWLSAAVPLRMLSVPSVAWPRRGGVSMLYCSAFLRQLLTPAGDLDMLRSLVVVGLPCCPAEAILLEGEAAQDKRPPLVEKYVYLLVNSK